MYLHWTHPQLSWTVNLVWGGVVSRPVTTSEYNGYKVYGADGAQVVAPEDAQLVAEVRALGFDEDVPRSTTGIRVLDHTWDERFRAMLASFDCLRICGTRIRLARCVHWAARHGGVGVPPALEAFGFRNVMEVASRVRWSFPRWQAPTRGSSGTGGGGGFGPRQNGLW